MKVIIDFERPPLRAVYRTELEAESADPVVAACQAGALLQLREEMRVRVLSVGIERKVRLGGGDGQVRRAIRALGEKPDDHPGGTGPQGESETT